MSNVLRHEQSYIPGQLKIAANSDDLCSAPVGYLAGRKEPNYPVPAIDYYNSNKPNHIAIGNLMEWSIPRETQLKFRS